MKIKVKCQQCGKEFKVIQSRIKDSRGKFCSKKCFYEYQRRNRVKKQCIQCGKIFETIPSRIKVGKGIFCSKTCKNKWRSENIKGENHPRWQRIKKICLICGKEFLIEPYRIKNSKVCSRECYRVWRSQNYIKDKVSSWKGGLTSITSKIRHNLKYSDWRLKVFERDNFICQKCGQRGGKLHAHHIKPFSQILEELKQQYPLLDLYDVAMMSKELWDISNGITLCEKCHKKIHFLTWSSEIIFGKRFFLFYLCK
jgi:5-methylcytosine-specific restriction endonuclease McrA